MEMVIVSRNRAVGLEEEKSGFTDLDYFSILPDFSESIGLISRKSISMLEKNRKKQIEENLIEILRFKKENFFVNENLEFFLYNMKNIIPILYEVSGYNCIVNIKNNGYKNLETCKSFFLKDHGFSKHDFDNLELHINYLICSYYEGEAAFIYVKDEMVNEIIERFNQFCINKCDSKIIIDEL